MFLQKMPISAENTQIGVFYDKKNDILDNLRARKISEENIGFLNLQSNLVWADVNTMYRIRNNKDRRTFNIHKYWALEGCPAYYLANLCFDSDDEANDMRACVKQARFFYMIGVQKRMYKTLYSHYNNDVIHKVYFKRGVYEMHRKGLKAFPYTDALPYSFCIRYNEHHVSQKMDDYLGEPVIICNVDSPMDYADSAYPEEMHSYFLFQRLSKILKREDIFYNVEALLINFDDDDINDDMQVGFIEKLLRRY